MVYGETAMVRFNLNTMNNQTRQEAVDALDVHEFPTGHAIGQGKMSTFSDLLTPIFTSSIHV